MQFWPLGVAVLGSTLVALAIIVLAVRNQRPGVVSKGPRHRWNRQFDEAVARQRRSGDSGEGER